MKRKLIVIIIIILLVILALFIIWLPSFLMTGNRQTLEEAFAWQTDHYDTSFYEELKKTDYTMETSDGYVIHAELLENPEPTDDYVIISHGYTDNRMGALKYVPLYLKLGFNCIVYDLRGHGENEPAFTTYSIREGEDLDCLIRDTCERYPKLNALGLHGESLGAATTVMCLKYKPEVDFAVADCGFSDIESVLKNGSAGIIIDLADIGSRIRYHYAIKEMRPIDSLDENTIPILFIHGADDDLIPPKNSEEMSKRTKGISKLCIIPGAGHAMSILTEPEMYADTVKTFLSELND